MTLKSIVPFLIFAILYLFFTLFELEAFTSWLKPLLIPLLAIALLKSDKFEVKRNLWIALFFSKLGDVLLLLAAKILYSSSGD